MECEYEFNYYPADNGAIIYLPDVGSVDVIQRADGNKSTKFAGSNYVGRMILEDIEHCYDEATKSPDGVVIGMNVTISYKPIMRQDEDK